jgi:arylsulfatase A-like enzyme
MVVAAAVGVALVATVLPGTRGPGGQSPDRPNIVLIVTDDQRWDTLEAMPAVGRLLVEGGVTFRNAFTTTPSCCPSRVGLLTGRYSRHTGVLDGSVGNAPGGAPAFDDRSSLATWLDGAGYRTGLVGKYLNDYAELPRGYVPPGWDEWFAIAQARPQIRYYDYELNENGTIVRYGAEAADYSTTVLREKALEFIRADRPAPFFLYFAPIAPHPPATPAPEDVAAPVAPFVAPTSLASSADVVGEGSGDATRVEALRAEMLRSLLAVDRAIEAISGAVTEAGLAEDTYFFFTSDNGFLWGEHGMLGKVWPYEESIRVPLVIRPPAGRTRRVDQIALNLDVAPSIAQLAGVTPDVAPDGVSLVPVLEDQTVPTRERFVVEFLGYAPGVPPYGAIRTERFLYVEYRDGRRELYDLRTDPHELRNLLGDHGRAPPGLVARLRSVLRVLMDA